MRIVKSDLVIVGAGGAGLRAAIAAAEQDPNQNIALLSKVYPMRSHTVAAEGGAAGVVSEEDSLENHFRDTVAGGDWLCDQEVVRIFVENITPELVRMEHWGCPWSRHPDGRIQVRRFGGMKIPRTWFAADKTGFHMLHTLFQTSIKFPNINRFDEYFTTDLLVEDGRVQGVLAIEIKTGDPVVFLAPAVILATGGSGRLFRFNTNGGIVTGDGMAMAFRAGAALRDMEFFQFHPTGLPGSGILMTEACRGEGGLLLNKDGYRNLQDYGLGPETPVGQPKNKYMELGPRDRLSQAFWHERRKGRTISIELGEVVHLDLRHLGEAYINERLPLIRDLAIKLVGVDPVKEPIPVLPVAHYTMGGIRTDKHTATDLPGLWAAGECSSVGMHGANRLGSNSLAELLVFGRIAGEQGTAFSKENGLTNEAALVEQAKERLARIESIRARSGEERVGRLRKEMAKTMDDLFGIYRVGEEMEQGLARLRELRERFQHIGIDDKTGPFNTDLLLALELEAGLDVAMAVAVSALNRKESRGAHQRLDGYEKRDDEHYLAHSVAWYRGDQDPEIEYQPVNITTFPPAERVYGAAGENADH